MSKLTEDSQYKREVPPKPPVPPLTRLINYDCNGGFCEECGSSVRSGGLCRRGGCINPECQEYYDKEESEL